VLAAEAVWVLLNGRYLPRSLARRARGALVINFVLITFISLIPGVSGAGHLGGALAGGAAALLFNFQRFGPTGWRWLALPALAVLPWGGWAVIERERRTNGAWHEAERVVFDKDFRDRVGRTIRDVEPIKKASAVLMRRPPRQRDPAKVEKALELMEGPRRELRDLTAALERAGPYSGEEAEEERRDALERVAAEERYLDGLEQGLRQGEDWSGRGDAEQAAFEERYTKRIHKTTSRANRFYEDNVRPLLREPPEDRDREKVAAVRAELAERRQELTDLGRELAAEGPFWGGDVEEARHTARVYCAVQARALAEAERCLRAGPRWTSEQDEALDKRLKAVKNLREKWENLIDRPAK
jgi:hypothetical protein